MKTFRLYVPLALIFSAFLFQTAHAAKVAVVHDRIGVPFTLSYIREQRVQQMHAAQGLANVDVLLVIPDDYPNWDFRFSNPNGDVTIATYSTQGNYIDGNTPILNLPEGDYNIEISCDNYNPEPFWIYFYWWETPDNFHYYQHFKMSGDSNAFYSSVILRDVQIVQPDASDPTELEITKL